MRQRSQFSNEIMENKTRSSNSKIVFVYSLHSYSQLLEIETISVSSGNKQNNERMKIPEKR